MLFTLYWLPPQATQSLCFINFRPDFSRLAISFHSHTNHPQNRCPLFLMHLAATPSTRYGNVWNKYLYKFSFYCNELYFTVLCRRLSCLDQQQLKISLDGFASFCFSLFLFLLWHKYCLNESDSRTSTPRNQSRAFSRGGGQSRGRMGK